MLNLRQTQNVSHTKNLSSKLMAFTIIFNAFFTVAISASVGEILQPTSESDRAAISATDSVPDSLSNSYFESSYNPLLGNIMTDRNGFDDTEHAIDLDRLVRYLHPTTDMNDDDNAFIDTLPEKRAPNTMSHFLRDRKAALGHFLRDRKALGHFLRDRKAPGNHLSHFLRDRKASINHFLRDRKTAWLPVRDLDVLRQIFANKSKKEDVSKRELNHLLRDRRSKNIREKIQQLTRF